MMHTRNKMMRGRSIKRWPFLLTAVIGVVALVFWGLGANSSSANTGGGKVVGKVTFTGKEPKAKEFVFSKFPNPVYCAKNSNKSADGKVRLLTEVRVASGGGLQDAIVAVRDINDDAWMKGYEGTKVFAELCEWSDFTGVVVNKGRFIVENNDADPDDPKSVAGVLHNPHAFEIKKPSALTIFNIGLAKKGDSLDKKITLRKVKAGSVVRLQCDQHEFMQAWYLPVTNPHFTKVKDDGSFELSGIPAGKHKLIAWHPIAGLIEQDVTVKEGDSVKADFELKP